MTDLLDLAKGARDAAIAELERVLDGHPPHVCEGERLGAHLASVLIAYTAERYNMSRGRLTDGDLMPLLSVAVSCILSHCATNFRPLCNGVVLPPSAVAQYLMPMIAECLFAKLAKLEHGLADYAIPFDRAEDGSLQRKPFDYQQHMKGKP